MSIKTLYSSEKTNSYRPTHWHWSVEPFAAFRGCGFRHRGFLAVAKDFAPSFVGKEPTKDGYECPTVTFSPQASKLIKTKGKGTLMLVPCSEAEDEQIMLITLRGGFRGGYSRIKAVGAEVLFKDISGGHCVVTGHMIVRLTNPQGFVYAETGRRCSSGLVEIFCWGGYKTMPTEDFEAWLENHAPDMDDTEAAAKASAQNEQDRLDSIELGKAIDANNREKEFAKAQAEAGSRAAKESFTSRIEDVNRQLELVEYPHRVELNEAFFKFFKFGWGEKLYNEENVKALEALAAEMLQKHEEALEKQKIRLEFQPRFEEFYARCEAVNIKLEFYESNVSWGNGCNEKAKYSEEGILKFVKALKEAEAIAEETKAQAEKETRELEAIKNGAPSDFTCKHERGHGKTHRECWVIMPNGSTREADRETYSRHKHVGTVWNVVYPGEVALMWEKYSAAGEHHFTVVHMETEQLTDEQADTICSILEEIEQQWEDARGLASQKLSPSVGAGWLNPNTGESFTSGFKTSRQQREEGDVSEDSTIVYSTEEVAVEEEPLKPASFESLQALLAKNNR